MTTTPTLPIKKIAAPALAAPSGTETPARLLEKEVPAPQWPGTTGGVSPEVPVLEVDGSQQGVAIYASLQTDRATLVGVYEFVFRLYAKIGTFRTLIDQGRMCMDGGGIYSALSNRYERLIAVGRTPADSYEVTVQSLFPGAFGPVVSPAFTGRIKVSARSWTEVLPTDDLGARTVRRSISKAATFFSDAAGSWLSVVRDGTVFLQRFTMMRTPVALDANVAHFWDDADPNFYEAKASVYCGNAPLVDIVWPQPVEFLRGLRITFGKPITPGALGRGSSVAIDTSGSGDDRIYVEHR